LEFGVVDIHYENKRIEAHTPRWPEMTQINSTRVESI
jgi:hypothetical protein